MRSSSLRELKSAVRRLLAAIDAEREARAAMRDAPGDLAADRRWIESVRELSAARVAADDLTRDKRRRPLPNPPPQAGEGVERSETGGGRDSAVAQ